MREIYIRAIRYNVLLGLSMLVQHLTSKAQLLHGIPYVRQEQVSSLNKTIERTKSASEKVNALILLGAYYFHNPYPRSINLNSAIRLASEAASLSKRAGLTKSYNDAQFLISYTYLRKNMLDSTAFILTSVNDSTRFKILLELGHAYRRGGKLDKAMDIALQAKEISKTLGDTLKQIMILREIACIHSETQQPDSEKELLEVIKLFQGVGYPYLHYTYYELCGLAFLQGNDDKGLYYSEQALKAMSQTKDSAGAADLLLCHGIILSKIGEHQKSIEYVKSAMEHYKSQYGDGSINDALRYLTEGMTRLNRQEEADKIITKLFKDYPPDNRTDSLQWLQTFATFYRLNKNYDKAEMYFKMNTAIREKYNLPIPYLPLGQLYVESGNFVKAKYYLEKALQQVDSTTSMRARAHLHYCLFLADSAMGNYLSAIQHLSKNKRYDDTVLKQSKVEAIEKYKAQFETEKKEADLKLKDQRISVLTKDQQLKDMNLERLKFIKNVTLYGSLLLLAASVVFYRQYRRKQRDSNIIARMNRQLQQSLTEKDWLIKEVHHRVKNNLHTIICLLESQAMYLEKDALQAIEKSQHRIYAMSLIHQKLYQNEDLRSIDMSIYLEEFIGYLKDSFDTQKIDFNVEVEPVHLNLQQAIPVALIINEGVTNAIKYAFSEVSLPTISISMTQVNEMVKLIISDNGKGFELKEENEGKSLGIQLIKGLSKELKGNVQIDTKKGTTLSIEFPKEPITDQIPVAQDDKI